MKRAVGRPTDYKPEYCQGVIEFGRKGKFHFEFANSISKHVSVIYAWGTKHEEFQEALKEAKQLCEDYWLNTGRALIASSPKSHDSKPWWYIMNNLHGWGEKTKVEVSGENGGPVMVQLSREAIKQANEIARAKNKRDVGRASD